MQKGAKDGIINTKAFSTKPEATMQSYTAKYIKLQKGYMGQIVEWPEVVTEGKDIEDCRSMLKDALHQMILAYTELGKSIPQGSVLYEQLPLDFKDVRKTA
jgi:predicted RNase H-like HicB family nuclease